jgi:hypothetical protein
MLRDAIDRDESSGLNEITIIPSSIFLISQKVVK